MDGELVSPASSCSPPSPASFFSASGPSVLEFVSCDVPEQWLVRGDELELELELDNPSYQEGAAWGSYSAGSNLSGNPSVIASMPAEGGVKRRGRKPGPRSDGPTVSHVEAERHRRERLHRRFCDLRAAVPTVSRMDKASLLADAAAYITELRGRVGRLEAEAKQRAAAAQKAPSAAASSSSSSHAFGGGLEELLEVRMVGREAAAVRLTTSCARHAPARLMAALRALDLPVQHACVSRVGALTVQDAIVDVPAAALRDEGRLRAALLLGLQECDGA